MKFSDSRVVDRHSTEAVESILMDTALFYLINRLPHWDWFDRLVLFVSDIQQKEALIVMGAVLIFGVVFKKRGLWRATLILIIAFVAVDQLVWWIKPFFHRARPAEVLEGVNILGGNAGGSSFPSSNAANVAVLFAFIYFVTRKNLVFWAGLTVLLGVFRVYKGIHFPSDLLGGWVLGVLGAWGASFFHQYVQNKFPGSGSDNRAYP